MYYHLINPLSETCVYASHQWYYDLTVGMRFEVVWGLESFTDESVVVDFAIDSKSNTLIAVGKWLSSRVDTNDRQTLVGKHYEGSEIAPPKAELFATDLCGLRYNFQTSLDHDAYTASPSSKP
jgi:hypothetical protein